MELENFCKSLMQYVQVNGRLGYFGHFIIPYWGLQALKQTKDVAKYSITETASTFIQAIAMCRCHKFFFTTIKSVFWFCISVARPRKNMFILFIRIIYITTLTILASICTYNPFPSLLEISSPQQPTKDESYPQSRSQKSAASSKAESQSKA